MRSFQHLTLAAGLMLAAAACSAQPTTIEAGQSPEVESSGAESPTTQPEAHDVAAADAEASPDETQPTTTAFEIPTTTGPPEAPGNERPDEPTTAPPLDGHESAVTTIAPADDAFTTDTTAPEVVYSGDTNSPYCERAREIVLEFSELDLESSDDFAMDLARLAEVFRDLHVLAPSEIDAELLTTATMFDDLAMAAREYESFEDLTTDSADMLHDDEMANSARTLDDYNLQICDVVW